MKTLSTLTATARLTAFAMALAASAVVLGSTIAGMQPGDHTGLEMVALERVTITAERVN